MYLDIARRYEVDLSHVPAVGDSLRDLQAAAAVGCSPWLVRTGKGHQTLKKGGLPPDTKVCDDLAVVVDALLRND